MSDLKEEFVRSGRFALTADGMARLAGTMDGLEAAARAWFDAEGIAPDDRGATLCFDARYVGQNFELPVFFAGGPQGALARPAGPDAVARAFHAEHERHYGFHSAGEPIEVVNIRVAATGRMATEGASFSAGQGGGAASGQSRPAAARSGSTATAQSKRRSTGASR